jgi:hypothetical protein
MERVRCSNPQPKMAPTFVQNIDLPLDSDYRGYRRQSAPGTGARFTRLRAMANNFLIIVSEIVGGRKNFKLVGRAEKVRRAVHHPDADGIQQCHRLRSDRRRHHHAALQARKADAPFDIVKNRLFWLDTDGLFGLGENGAIVKQFKSIFAILDRNPRQHFDPRPSSGDSGAL